MTKKDTENVRKTLSEISRIILDEDLVRCFLKKKTKPTGLIEKQRRSAFLPSCAKANRVVKSETHLTIQWT